MTTFKYISDNVVAVIDDDGKSRWSCTPQCLSSEDLASAKPADPIPQPSLDDIKVAACTKIDEAAYQTRLKYITPNKDSTYLAKSIQVDAYVAAGYPTDLTNFGYISAEIDRLGLDVKNPDDLKTAANGLVAIRNMWLAIDAQIEQTCLVAKANVSKKLKESTILTAIDQARTDFGEIK